MGQYANDSIGKPEEKWLQYLLYILALFGLIFLFVLLIKLTLWCLNCNLSTKTNIKLAREKNLELRKYSSINKPPTPPPPTYDTDDVENNRGEEIKLNYSVRFLFEI